MKAHRIATCLGTLAGFIPSTLALAQTRDPDADAAAACAVLGGCWLAVILLFILGVLINIAILIWVARDAKARGDSNPILWVLLIFFTGLIGLIIYIFARPKGDLVKCPNCNNKRLQAGVKCPHCGAA